MIASVLQIVGLLALAAAGFTISVTAGLAVLGVVAFATGIALEVGVLRSVKRGA